MGNGPLCNAQQQSMSFRTSVIGFEPQAEPQNRPQMIEYKQQPQEDPFQKFKSKISNMKIQKKTPIELQILEQGESPSKISVQVKNDKKKLKQFVDQQNKYTMVNIAFANKNEESLNMVFIDMLADKSMYVVAFVGVEREGKREKGIYFIVKSKEVVIFNGVFSQVYNVGLKITKTSNTFERHWGKFNTQFQAEGEGSAIIITKKQEELAEEHYFQGSFHKGRREGKGNLKIKFDSNNIQFDQLLRSTKLSQIQAQLSSNRTVQILTRDMIEFITEVSSYNPLKPQPYPSMYFDLYIASNWHNNSMDGFTQEFWPNQQIRFEGMYTNNQRNGYGQQYSYDKLTAKGFYKDGQMETDSDNEFLLMGFKLVDDQWVRSKQEEDQLIPQ